MAVILVGLSLATVPVTPALAAVTHVQSTGDYDDLSAQTLSKAFTSNNTAGNTIVVSYAWETDVPGTPVCSDTRGNSYANAVVNQAGGRGMGVCYASNIASGANTVTVDFGASFYYRRLAIHEYSGLATSSVVDVKAAESVNMDGQATDEISSTPANPGYEGDLVFGTTFGESASPITMAAGTGYTGRVALSNDGFLTEDLVQNTAAPIAATFTQTGTDQRQTTVMVAFRSANGLQVPPSSGIAFVQTAGFGESGTLGDVQATFHSDNTAGNAIVVSTSYNYDEPAPVCTDSQGNTYQTITAQQQYSSPRGIANCIATNIAAGPNQVTVTYSQGMAARSLIVTEYRNVAHTDPIDRMTSNTAVAPTSADGFATPSTNTTCAGDLIYSVVSDDDVTSTVTAGMGYSMRQAVYSRSMLVQDKILNTPGTVVATATMAMANPSTIQMLAIKAEDALCNAPAGVTTSDGFLLTGLSGSLNQRMRNYSGSSDTFSDPTTEAMGDRSRSLIARSSPKENTATAAYIDEYGYLRTMCYDGARWHQEWSVQISSDVAYRTFDIAYETNSGDAMVLYATDAAATNELAYRTKTGGTACGAGWSSATNLDPIRTSLAVKWVKLAWDRRSSSNLLTAIWVDNDRDLSAMQWSGSAWGNEPTASLATSVEASTGYPDQESFDVEYESSSGDVMVVWGISAGTDGVNGVRYATCTGGTASCTWSAVTTPATFLDDASHVDIAANPANDEIVFASLGEAGKDLQAGYWSGSAWTNTANLDTSAQTVYTMSREVAVGWLTSGGATRSIIVFADSGSTSVHYYLGNGSNFGTANTPSNLAVSTPFDANQINYRIEMDPTDSSKLMLLVGGQSGGFFAKRVQLSAGPTIALTNSDGGQIPDLFGDPGGFSFAYWRFMNLAPTAPSSIAQYKSNGSTGITTAAWTNQSTVVLKATVSDSDAGNTIALCAEVQPVASAFTNTENYTCGSAAAIGATASVTITGLSSNTQYKWQVRGKDNHAMYSNWTRFNSGGDAFSVDTTGPTVTYVYDGTTVDIFHNGGSVTDISGNWAATDTSGSGVASYEYSIGTGAGLTDVVGWTSNAALTFVTASGLTLDTSLTYFVNVRATDAQGNVGAVLSSNGQQVGPFITVTMASSLDLGILNSGNSYTNSANLPVNIQTNATGGYKVRQYALGELSGTSGTISSIGSSTPGAWPGAGANGYFGFTSSDTTVDGAGDTFAGGTLYAGLSPFAPGDIVADQSNTPGNVLNDNLTFGYKVQVPGDKTAGSYSVTVIVQTTPQF